MTACLNSVDEPALPAYLETPNPAHTITFYERYGFRVTGSTLTGSTLHYDHVHAERPKRGLEGLADRSRLIQDAWQTPMRQSKRQAPTLGQHGSGFERARHPAMHLSGRQ